MLYTDKQRCLQIKISRELSKTTRKLTHNCECAGNARMASKVKVTPITQSDVTTHNWHWAKIERKRKDLVYSGIQQQTINFRYVQMINNDTQKKKNQNTSDKTWFLFLVEKKTPRFLLSDICASNFVNDLFHLIQPLYNILYNTKRKK